MRGGRRGRRGRRVYVYQHVHTYVTKTIHKKEIDDNNSLNQTCTCTTTHGSCRKMVHLAGHMRPASLPTPVSTATPRSGSGASAEGSTDTCRQG